MKTGRWFYQSFLTMVMFAMIILGLSSCNGDDDDNGNNPLVGTWSCSEHYVDWVTMGDGVDTYIFKSDGKYEWSCRGWDSKSGDYNYNSSLSTLTLSDKKGTTSIYIIPSITDSYFVMLDEDGDSYTYRRK